MKTMEQIESKAGYGSLCPFNKEDQEVLARDRIRLDCGYVTAITMQGAAYELGAKRGSAEVMKEQSEWAEDRKTIIGDMQRQQAKRANLKRWLADANSECDSVKQELTKALNDLSRVREELDADRLGVVA